MLAELLVKILLKWGLPEVAAVAIAEAFRLGVDLLAKGRSVDEAAAEVEFATGPQGPALDLDLRKEANEG